MKKDSFILAVALEAVGILTMVLGLAIETAMHAQIGFIIITTGSVFMASGGFLFAKIFRKR